jgi:hypothetical protein
LGFRSTCTDLAVIAGSEGFFIVPLSAMKKGLFFTELDISVGAAMVFFRTGFRNSRSVLGLRRDFRSVERGVFGVSGSDANLEVLRRRAVSKVTRAGWLLSLGGSSSS